MKVDLGLKSTSCRDGASRSGLYCVLSSVLERLQVEQKVDIPSVILHMRHQRPHIITSLVHGPSRYISR